MMKKILLILIVITFFNEKVFAVTLSGALLQAFNENPELNAERENIKASKEDVKISKSEFLPSITLSGSKSQENTEKLTNRNGTNSAITDVDPKNQSIDIEQKIFQGYAGIASLEKSNLNILICYSF